MKCKNCDLNYLESFPENCITFQFNGSTTILWICSYCDTRNKEVVKKG